MENKLLRQQAITSCVYKEADVGAPEPWYMYHTLLYNTMEGQTSQFNLQAPKSGILGEVSI